MVFIYRYDQINKRESYEIMRMKRKLKDNPKYHWGQRKLLISEILFLSKYNRENKIVLYVGAANGYHIQYLTSLFPNMYFILYDPGTFHPILYNNNKIEIHKQLFTDQDAKKYRQQGNKILFISDIRNLQIREKIKSGKESELILQDLALQKKWIELIKPYRSFLKFRLPYNAGKTQYFDGSIYLQPWSPLSTETRLLVRDSNKMKIYDNIEMDEKMAYFNHNTRFQCDKVPKIIADYNMRCLWDLIYEFKVLKKYLQSINKYNEKNLYDLHESINNFLKQNNNRKALQFIQLFKAPTTDIF